MSSMTVFSRIYANALIVLVSLATNNITSANAEKSIIVQSTTSTKNSGLYDYILPQFEAATGVSAKIVAVGTGQALRNAQNCDGDVLLVHAKSAEDRFVADGFGTRRHDLMYNDFVVVGPAEDTAKIKGVSRAEQALINIAKSKAVFISRGDDSGTHKKEMTLWNAAKTDPHSGSGIWYREVGAGMGAALNAAVGMGGYVLSDRATWIAFKNKRDFQIMVEGDPELFNQYGVTAVNPKHCPSVNAVMANRFVEWLVSSQGQSAIARYRRSGQQLFFPNAPPMQ
ncbi:MAG: substrate-binding domain-containing protein [Hyphomicrobiaceae bacterium]